MIELAKRGDLARVRAALVDGTLRREERALLVRMLAISPGDDAPWVELLAERAARDADTTARLAAVRALGERRGDAAAQALARLARAPGDPAQTGEIVQALGRHFETGAVALLTDLAFERIGVSPEVARAAVRGLGNIYQYAPRAGQRTDRPTAGAAAADATPAAAAADAAATMRATTAAFDALALLLGRRLAADLDKEVVLALGSPRRAEAVPPLRAYAQDLKAAWPARHAAVDALGFIPGAAATEALAELAATVEPVDLRAHARSLHTARSRTSPPEPR